MAQQGYLAELNAAQREAVEYGVEAASRGEPMGPLLIIAGAGSGKTNALAHRVSHLILNGVDPARLLLLTFTRRAAVEMTRRARRILAQVRAQTASRSAPTSERARSGEIHWSGTFHAVANRLLRMHSDSIGLDPSFTVLDRSDGEDLLNLLRDELGLASKSARFPKKATCMSIYSHAVNAQRPLEEVLEVAFPWCAAWKEELPRLFSAYVEAKQRQNVLDYDDLLLYWHHMMAEPLLAEAVRERFDHVLVDEYQDTNRLQAQILLGLKPDGQGLTVVGDDAQAIYSFRAATVRNILDFPALFKPAARVIRLEENYRSSRPILAACNAVIGLAEEGYRKTLFSSRISSERPRLVTVENETVQAEYVVERVLEQREAGIPLRRQAVLIRTGHHSDLLEIELGRRNIPFVKFGGLKFLEAAHVKDMLCVLRWAENPRDRVASFRVLQLLPGIGPGHARRALGHLEACGFNLAALETLRPPAAAAEAWPALCRLLAQLRSPDTDWHAQLGLVRHWYQPHLERNYDSVPVRAGDLEQLEQIAGSYVSRERFLSELTLDPPEATGDEAGPPLLDEDYLILSTIHSAKGQEWDVVYVLNVSDGCIPSDMATGRPEQIEEERRLLYVAMTRARDHLYLVQPHRFYRHQQNRHGDRHVYGARTRFIPSSILDRFERSAPQRSPIEGELRRDPHRVRVDIGARLRETWS